VLVWASPYLLVINRRPRKRPAMAGPGPGQATPPS
jgi:hypothetical protein